VTKTRLCILPSVPAIEDKMMMTRMRAALQLVLVLSFCNVVLAQSTGTFTPTGNMNVPRYGHTATLLTNGKVLIAGGTADKWQPLSSAELYDPATGTFTPTGDMTWPQSGHTATLLPDGKVLIVGGSGQSGSTVKADLYDPDTGTFRPVGFIQSAAADCPSAALLNSGKVLIAFGTYYPGPKGLGSPALLYDPVEQQFSAAAVSTIDVVEEEACPTATLLADGKVLVTWQNPAAELYRPDDNSFVRAGTMIVPVEYWGYTAIPLTTGNVLIAGGEDYWDNTSAELYDPSVPTFKSTGYLKHARGRPTATLLPDGKVLMAGGYTALPLTPSALNTAEIYDPGDGTFSSTGEMVASRAGHTATLLMDGRVLIVGGSTLASYPLSPDSSAELYVPAVLSPAQVVTSIQFDRTSVVTNTSYSVNVSGSNLAPQTFFDVRFSAPGAKEFAVVLNWQRGITASHEVPTGTASGIWTINGVRAHQIETDHSGNFVPVLASITVSP
jgi:Galactose oxidase, central domain